MTSRRALIAGNWKMNGLRTEGTSLASALLQKVQAEGQPAAELLVCPPFPWLLPVGEVLSGSALRLGAQDCHAKANGAHTGDVSAPMLRDAECAYVILGHSERRQDHGETDAVVRAKVAAAHGAGLTAIVCVGETEAEREQGRAFDVVAGQLAGSIPDGATAANTVVAYEPVWAIGTGKTPTLDDIAAMHGHIRSQLAARVASADGVRILYGGSVKPSNAAEILALVDVDGALVGGASLKAEDFWAIARSSR
ncbi:MAG TPA: triose-phosphate isomerase [Azospirillaceae bacterium]|nr:triose-phosphate isomerase [Azospirillaceae bacterium]